MTEEQLYKFIDLMRAPNMLDRPLVDWLNCGERWALAGIAEPTFLLNGTLIRGIMDFPYVYINNPDLFIEITNSLTHIYTNGNREEFFITYIDYSPYSRGDNPIYKLTITRLKTNMQNSFNIGGNLQMSGNSHLNTGNVNDYSTNEIYELPANFFSQAHELLTNVNESYRQEFLDILNKIEATKNPKEGGQLFAKLISLSFIADCVTVLQPIIKPLFNYFIH